MKNYHNPVMVQEIVKAFKPRKGKVYIDATVGFGGHALALVEKGARVLGIDRDGEEIALLKKKCKEKNISSNVLTLVCGNYVHIQTIAKEYGFDKVDGILYDLGFSSWHLEESGRGFSYMRNEPIDLRFDTKKTKITGADILNSYSKKELAFIFSRYGELEQADEIASIIVSKRPFWYTAELNGAIALLKTPISMYRLLARVYQALRIVVNEELSLLEMSLIDAVELLKQDGKLCVISFHSLEDRIVKLFLKRSNLVMKTKKPIMPTKDEIQRNRRAKSAKLRIAKRII